MLILKLIFPIFSLLWGLLFFYFPKTTWNNPFVLLHRQDKDYLYNSNKFIGKTMMFSSIGYLIFSLIPSLSIFMIFWPWLVISALLIPLYFEITWRHKTKLSHQ